LLDFHIYGGSLFKISEGATPPFYLAQPTSYDYDAPLSEAGDITQKYLAIRQSISKYLTMPNVTIPMNQTKFAYGKISMTYVILLFCFSEISSKKFKILKIFDQIISKCR